MRTSSSRDHDAASVWQHVRAIALLPFMNTVIVPSIILASTRDASLPATAADLVRLAAGALLLGAGAALVWHSIGLFVRIGRGTLAPWSPARALITEGAYRRCRNPMKAGLFIVLLAEALLFRSAPLLYWFIAFALVNLAYIRAYEEPMLRIRFGHAYAEYCAHVPRWWPRWKPWQPPFPAGEPS